jgi:hypothetical protein
MVNASLSSFHFELNSEYLDIYQKHESNLHSHLGHRDPEKYTWLLPDAVRLFARMFHDREKRGRVGHLDIIARKRDRRSASPFITDDAFRTHCAPYLCLEDDIERNAQEPMTGDNCHIDRIGNYDKINGTCVFVMASLLPVFVEREIPKLKERGIHFSLVTDRFNDQSGLLLLFLSIS